MNGWQRKVDIYLKQVEEKQKQEEREKELREEKLYNQQLAEHQAHFRCNVCNKPSSGPYMDTCADDGGGHSELYPVWHKPADLEECIICKKWAVFMIIISPHS